MGACARSGPRERAGVGRVQEEGLVATTPELVGDTHEPRGDARRPQFATRAVRRSASTVARVEQEGKEPDLAAGDPYPLGLAAHPGQSRTRSARSSSERASTAWYSSKERYCHVADADPATGDPGGAGALRGPVPHHAERLLGALERAGDGGGRDPVRASDATSGTGLRGRPRPRCRAAGRAGLLQRLPARPSPPPPPVTAVPLASSAARPVMTLAPPSGFRARRGVISPARGCPERSRTGAKRGARWSRADQAAASRRGRPRRPGPLSRPLPPPRRTTRHPVR